MFVVRKNGLCSYKYCFYEGKPAKENATISLDRHDRHLHCNDSGYYN